MSFRILGIDIETSGLDFGTDFITEVAWMIKDHKDPKAMDVKSFFCKPQQISGERLALPENVSRLTKIQPKHLEHGHHIVDVLSVLCDDVLKYDVKYIVAHNGAAFDRPFLLQKAKETAHNRYVSEVDQKTWIDTTADVSYPEEMVALNLIYLCGMHGFCNPFPHSALFDVASMLKILDTYNIDEVLVKARSPWVTLKAEVSYDDRQKASSKKYRWVPEQKSWLKRIKACDVEKEKAAADFKVTIVEDKHVR